MLWKINLLSHTVYSRESAADLMSVQTAGAVLRIAGTGGSCTLNLGLSPKSIWLQACRLQARHSLDKLCDMKHCSTNSESISIGAKGAFCGLQNTPKYVSGWGWAPDPAGELTTLPRPTSRLGRDKLYPCSREKSASKLKSCVKRQAQSTANSVSYTHLTLPTIYSV